MISESVQALGFIAQGLFSARFIVQWISSEKAGKVLAPALFWQLSLFASLLLILYSILAKDISILLGQMLGYYIYIRNLKLQKNWNILPKAFRYPTLVLPLTALILLFFTDEYSWSSIWDQHTSWIYLAWGLIGQAIFTSRFIYQWYYAEQQKKSVLPLGFWILSIAGAFIIITYSFYFNLYPILFGHCFGVLVYSRNIIIHFKEVKN